MRYRFIQDESCHWYLVPADKYEEVAQVFEAIEANVDIWGDDAEPETPDYCIRIDGVHSISFTNPQEC